MRALEAHQRGLLDLLKNRAGRRDDPYLRQVDGSRELAMLRKIALWWQAFAIETQCRWTTRLCKRLGCFDALVAQHFDRNATSPFVEELGLQFVRSLRGHDDGLIRSVSQFEYALHAHTGESGETCEIEWDRNPDVLIGALETGAALPAREPNCLYRLRVGSGLPRTMACTREMLPGEPMEASGPREALS
jgi:hypothetical protein